MLNAVTPRFKDFFKDFELTDGQLRDVYKQFCYEIRYGIRNPSVKTDINSTITYVQDLPTGDECGKSVSVQLESSNLHVSQVVLKGNHKYTKEVRTFSIPKDLLVVPIDELLDYMVECLDIFLSELRMANELLPLGFTLDFPCTHRNLEKAIPIKMTKGFHCLGLVEEDVGTLLKEAIQRRGSVKIDLSAVVNEATSILAYSAYKKPECRIGLSLNDGCMATYMERSKCVVSLQKEFWEKKYVSITSDWNSFGDSGTLEFIRNSFDQKICDISFSQGVELFKKMVTGEYIGMLLQLMLLEANKSGLIFTSASNIRKTRQTLSDEEKYITANQVTDIQRDDTSEFTTIKSFLDEFLQIENPSNDDCIKLKYICEIVCKRAANLIALGVSALVNKINESKIVIGVEGPIVRNHYKFIAYMKETMRKFVHPKIQFDFMTTENGVRLGPAVLASITSENSLLKSFNVINAQLTIFLSEFLLTERQMTQIYASFKNELLVGLSKTNNHRSDIKCLITYLQNLPTGHEVGNFLALDFGGSTFRIVGVFLAVNKPLTVKSETFSITKDLMVGTGEKLFAYLADCLTVYVNKYSLQDDELPLTLTFAFPSEQKALNSVVLVRWTKGFNCSGVENENVVQLLNEAIAKCPDLKIKVLAAVNEATGILVSCAHQYSNCRIGVIIDNCTNACYVEHSEKVQMLENKYKNKKYVVINCEWATFGGNGSLDFIRTEYDHSIDEMSFNKGVHIFEKMVGGTYLCDLVRSLLRKAIQEDLIFTEIKKKTALIRCLADNEEIIQQENISKMEDDNPKEMKYTASFIQDIFNIDDVGYEDCLKMRYICAVVSKRAATLVAIPLSVLINKVNIPKIIVGMEGYIYRTNPKYDSYMREVLRKYVKPRIEFDLIASDDGSGRGAALIAGVVEKDIQSEII